ncbi:MAG: hypothetical protein HQL86_05005 [Magnetococcales bacterium]|nr:hypothetical protein [Magnetococcales bacterium]
MVKLLPDWLAEQDTPQADPALWTLPSVCTVVGGAAKAGTAPETEAANSAHPMVRLIANPPR